MTTHKTFKQRIRARAAKTGESYSTARSQLLRRAQEPAPDARELTGMSEEALQRGSGRPIAEWLRLLDDWGAKERKHPEIARWLVSEHGVGGWWAQSITVGYERARGMRAMHQEPGGFAISASRTIDAEPERISDAFTDPSLRDRWLPDAPISTRTANRGRSGRFDWGEPPSLVTFTLSSTGHPAGQPKTRIGLGHEKLPDADAADRMKAMWRERLTSLKQLLESS